MKNNFLPPGSEVDADSGSESPFKQIPIHITSISKKSVGLNAEKFATKKERETYVKFR